MATHLAPLSGLPRRRAHLPTPGAGALSDHADHPRIAGARCDFIPQEGGSRIRRVSGSWSAVPAGGRGGDAGCRPEACCENRDHVGGSLPVALAPRRLAMARFTPGILARPRGHEAGGPWDRAGSQWRAVSLPREMPRTPARHNPQVGIDGPTDPDSGSALGIGPVLGQCRFLRVISEQGHRRAPCGKP